MAQMVESVITQTMAETGAARAEFLGRLGETTLVDVADDDPGALLGATAGGGEPDAGDRIEVGTNSSGGTAPR